MPRKGNVKGSKGKSHSVAKKGTSRKETRAIEPVTEQFDNKVIDDKSPASKEMGTEKNISSYFLSSPESKKGLPSTDRQTSSSLDTEASIQDKTESNYTFEKQHDGFITIPRSDLCKQTSSANERQESSSVQEKRSKEHTTKLPSKDTGNVKEIINESQPLTKKGDESNTRPVNSPIVSWPNSQKTSLKGKGKKEKSKAEGKHRQSEVSDYFAVRRSDRKCKSAIEDEKRRKLEEALLSGKEEDLEVQNVEGKGRGIFTKRHFSRGEFVCEYAGELIDHDTAKEREKFYEGKMEFGCYMYYFTFKNKKFCVDATRETGRLGRLLNHSRTEANCATRLISIKERPYLILETIKDVKEGEELMYDYGERSKDIIHSHPWLKR